MTNPATVNVAPDPLLINYGTLLSVQFQKSQAQLSIQGEIRTGSEWLRSNFVEFTGRQLAFRASRNATGSGVFLAGKPVLDIGDVLQIGCHGSHMLRAGGGKLSGISVHPFMTFRVTIGETEGAADAMINCGTINPGWRQTIKRPGIDIITAIVVFLHP